MDDAVEPALADEYEELAQTYREAAGKLEAEGQDGTKAWTQAAFYAEKARELRRRRPLDVRMLMPSYISRALLANAQPYLPEEIRQQLEPGPDAGPLLPSPVTATGPAVPEEAPASTAEERESGASTGVHGEGLALLIPEGLLPDLQERLEEAGDHEADDGDGHGELADVRLDLDHDGHVDSLSLYPHTDDGLAGAMGQAPGSEETEAHACPQPDPDPHHESACVELGAFHDPPHLEET